jgi:hypothetical protein
MFTSRLFGDDPLLNDIVHGVDVISTTQHNDDVAVQRIQEALFRWDSSAITAVTGIYDDDTAAVVHRFKTDEIGESEPVTGDVDTAVVVRLDRIATFFEARLDLGTVYVATPDAADDELFAIREAIEQNNGTVVFGMGDRAGMFWGDSSTRDAVDALVGSTVLGVMDPDNPEQPQGVDNETAFMLTVWQEMLDDDYILDKANPENLGTSFSGLSPCMPEVTL